MSEHEGNVAFWWFMLAFVSGITIAAHPFGLPMMLVGWWGVLYGRVYPRECRQ